MEAEIEDLSNPLWKNPDWPAFYCNHGALASQEARVKTEVAKISKSGELSDLMLSEMLANSEIEGVQLSREKLQSSFLGNLSGSPHDREANVVQAMRLAVDHFREPITHEFIKELNALFNELPNRGRYVGGVSIIKPGQFHRTTIVERGVPANGVEQAMDEFVQAYNDQRTSTPLYNAIAGHVHFEKVHPFSDGNGRTGRVLMNMAFMRDLDLKHPVALSRAIHREHKLYYEALNQAGLDLTGTIKDLSPMIYLAFQETVRMKELTDFRKQIHSTDLNARQIKALNHLVAAELKTGYVGNFTSPKFAALTKTSESTALRDLRELVKAGLLVKKGTSKGAHYVLPFAV